MFTPGFKFFGGLALVGLIGAFVYGLSSSGAAGPDYFGFVDRNAVVGLISLGWKGSIGAASGTLVLIFMATTAAFLGGTAVAFRDADVERVAELGDTPSVMPLAQRPTAPSWWPATTALGLGVLLIGLVLDTTAFWILGLVLLAGTAIEWALTAWADRSTGDVRINAAVRDRVGAQFEIPVLGLALTAVVALAISRIFIWATGNTAVLIAGILSLIIVGVAVLAVFKPDLGKRTMGAIVGVIALAIITLGIVTAVIDPLHGSHDDEHDSEESATATVVSE